MEYYEVSFFPWHLSNSNFVKIANSVFMNEA